MLRVHRIPFSTNVERIALAAGHKGLRVTWIDHDPADRSGLVAVSGQPLAPVAELDDGRVITDSPVILRALEALVPEPALWPADPAARAEADVLLEWFDACWKPAPNRIAGGTALPDDAATLEERTARIEGLLDDGRPFLLGQAFGIADVTVAPFLRLCGGAPLAPGDEDPFHAVLHDVPVGPRTRAWLARVAERPRA